jgi:hypothetical protein
MAGVALAKIATALVLLNWPQRSSNRLAVTVAVAWCAVQSYTGAVFVAMGIFTALLAEPMVRRDWPALRRTALVMAMVVALLQVPYALHQVSTRFSERAMGAVTGSVGEILSGRQAPQFERSWAGYAFAVNFIQGAPWQTPWMIWLLVLCGAIVAIRYRRHDLPLLAVTLLPQIAALIGFALYVGDFLDRYYYLSLMPAAVLTIVLGLTSLYSRQAGRMVAVALFGVALAVVPARLRHAAPINRMPEYGVIVDASRAIAGMGQPVRAIRTEFVLPPTSDPEFIFQILGGRIDRAARLVAVIKQNGDVAYEKAGE